MINFTFSLELMSRVGPQHETFRGWHEMQNRDKTPVKTNGSKTSSLFEKVSNITSTS